MTIGAGFTSVMLDVEEHYGFWQSSSPDYFPLERSEYMDVTNVKLNNFRHFYGRGYDFAVIYRPHDLEIMQNVKYKTI